MLARPNAPEAEAFRLLRANLQFALVNGRPRSLLVTSSVQGEEVDHHREPRRDHGACW